MFSFTVLCSLFTQPHFVEYLLISEGSPRMASSYANPTRSEACRFMNLPTELRIKIYEECLQSPKGVTLRLPAELADVLYYPWKKVRPAQTIKDTAILRINHKSYDEALAVFYAKNRFHYLKQKDITCWPPRFAVHLSMMRHISLEYNDIFFHTEHLQQHSATSDDANIECLVMQLMQHSPRLQTFSLYAISPPRFSACQDQRISDAAATAVRLLKARLDRLTIVTYGHQDYLEAFRMAIAPGTQWRLQHLGDWPRVTMHWKQYRQIYLRPSADLFRYDKRIRVWHTSRLDLIETELWEESELKLWDRYQTVARDVP